MFHPAFHLFLLAGVERPGIGAAEIAAHPAGDRDLGRVVVATFRAGEAFAGAGEFTGETALVALVDRRVGAVVRHPTVAVVPHVFQRLQVVLQVRVLAVADEAAAGQRRVGRFEVQLVVRIDLLLHVEVEAVGVIALVGDARHHAEIGGVQPAEAIAQVLARRAVEAEAVAGLVFPGVDGGAQARDDRHRFGAQRFVVIHVVFAAEQRVDGLVQADIAQRD